MASAGVAVRLPLGGALSQQVNLQPWLLRRAWAWTILIGGDLRDHTASFTIPSRHHANHACHHSAVVCY